MSRKMRPFKNVDVPKIRRSVFDLSYSKLLDANMGLLYPVMCDEMVPGDSFKVSAEVVARVMPLITPMLHEVNLTIHYFFVPYRLLWDDWTDFISGGVDGEDASVLPRMPYPGNVAFDAGTSLWDYLGFPRIDSVAVIDNIDTLPIDMPRLAYSFIWNEYYRDETLQTEIDLANPSDVLLRRSWTKDYFTSALPWAQRGIAPGFPLTGILPVDGLGRVDFVFENLPPGNQGPAPWLTGFVAQLDTQVATSNPGGVSGYWNDVEPGTTGHVGRVNPEAPLDENGDPLDDDLNVDLSGGAAADINDMRLAWQIQRWMERNARAGVRYTEFLQSHFAVSPRDERLARPEYCGGVRAPLIVSEVLQTSESGTTPQGNLAGHGISVARQYAGKYFATEYGLMMGLMSIMPAPAYHQGINRQWLRRTKYDFYFPEFSTLGEQAIEMAEIFMRDTDVENMTEFGFQGRYDEMRYKPNIVCGAVRPGGDFENWTLVRDFANAPELNNTFIECNPDPRAWAVQAGAPQFIVHVGNKIKAVRPIPIMGIPGMVDHH